MGPPCDPFASCLPTNFNIAARLDKTGHPPFWVQASAGWDPHNQWYEVDPSLGLYIGSCVYVYGPDQVLHLVPRPGEVSVFDVPCPVLVPTAPIRWEGMGPLVTPQGWDHVMVGMIGPV